MASGLSGLFLLVLVACVEGADGQPSPQDLAFSPDGSVLAVADAGCDAVRLFDPASGVLRGTVRLAGRARGLAWDAGRLLAAEYDAGSVAEIDPVRATIARRLTVGPKPWGVAVVPANHRILVVDFGLGVMDALIAGAASKRIPSLTAPRYVAASADGTIAVVANSIPAGDATRPEHAAQVSIIDLASLRPLAEVLLPAGSSNLRGVCLSTDGRWAYVVHTLGKVSVPTVQVTRGWVNTNVLSIIDVRERKHYATVLLDTATAGAADPWGLVLADGGKTAWIALAGIHQLARVDLGRLHTLLDPAAPLDGKDRQWQRYRDEAVRCGDLHYDLTLLPGSGLLQRFPLPGVGPRGLALSPDGRCLAVAMYFSGEVLLLDPADPERDPRHLALPSGGAPSQVRRGEAAFHDARTTMQGWLSCATCHPGGRADGLNWDMPNDGVGNPKNTKSLVLAGRTPPAMWLGIRASMEVAAEKGFHFIEFSQPTPEVLADTRAYIAALEPEASPHLVAGRLSAQAEAGKRLFAEQRVGCTSCHAPPLHTDLKMHAVGTALPGEEAPAFDTPTCQELWTGAPYLHGGQAATLRELLTILNSDDRHGRTSKLGPDEVDALIAYLLSL